MINELLVFDSWLSFRGCDHKRYSILIDIKIQPGYWPINLLKITFAAVLTDHLAEGWSVSDCLETDRRVV